MSSQQIQSHHKKCPQYRQNCRVFILLYGSLVEGAACSDDATPQKFPAGQRFPQPRCPQPRSPQPRSPQPRSSNPAGPEGGRPLPPAPNQTSDISPYAQIRKPSPSDGQSQRQRSPDLSSCQRKMNEDQPAEPKLICSFPKEDSPKQSIPDTPVYNETLYDDYESYMYMYEGRMLFSFINNK